MFILHRSQIGHNIVVPHFKVRLTISKYGKLKNFPLCKSEELGIHDCVVSNEHLDSVENEISENLSIVKISLLGVGQ